MKKQHIKCLAMLLALLLALTACSSGNNGGSGDSSNDNGNGTGTTAPAPSNGGEPIKDIIRWETSGTRELEEFFILHTEQAKDLNVLTNAYSPLLELSPPASLDPRWPPSGIVPTTA